MAKTPAPRKHLSADALFRTIHESFQDVSAPRTGIPTIKLPDALMSGFAMFALNRDSPYGSAWNRSRQGLTSIVTAAPPCLARGDFLAFFRALMDGRQLKSP